MRMLLCVLMGVLAQPACAQARAAGDVRGALLPMPASVESGEGTLELTGGWSVAWSNCASASLSRAFERFDADFGRLTGVRPAADSIDAAVEIRCATDARRLDAMDKEGYALSVSSNGIRIDADGSAGVLRALATLRQLIALDDGTPRIPHVVIRDSPRFSWRGIMLDTARHFIEVQTLERQIDAMERVKLNVLHLHLSDDQGFRVESRKLPRLNTVSSHGQFYTQAQVRHLVDYAAARGVLIVPEFDVPGHSRAMVDAYPDVGVTAVSARPPFPADVALNPASPATWRFLDTLINEMASLFPGPWFHFGGDEVSDAVWQGHASIDAWKQREHLVTKHDVEKYFAKRVARIVRDAGKTPIGWDELTGADLGDDVVVQAWQSSNATAAATAKGHRTIVSAGYYLDLLMPADFHYAVDPLSSSSAGFTPAEAERVRSLHPLLAQMLTEAKIAKPLPPLTDAQQRLVLGGEAPLWGELVTDEILDHRLWPRAAALAERFWSPSSVRDPADMYERLAIVHDRLNVTGLRSDSNRRRMAMRLAPGASGPVHVLLDIVTPVRNMAHDHRILAAARGLRISQPLNALADAAPADSLIARGFIASTRKFLAGDASLEPLLRAQLAGWRDNDAQFRSIARGNAMLEPALPVSESIAALAQIGLGAIDALVDTSGKAQPWAPAEKVLEQAEAHEEASRLPLASFIGRQPPADLIIAITPGIRALVAAAREKSVETPAASAGMSNEPCIELPPVPDAVKEFNDAFLRPGKPELLRLLALTQRPEFVAYDAARKRREAQDWAGLCHYRKENAALIAEGRRPRVIFYGDSITQNWPLGDPALFDGTRIGRGIGGQTSAQMLVRFSSDVLALRPQAVHILAGTNDIAGNTGPTSERAYQDSIGAMVALARAHGIRVVLASIPPAAKFPWQPQVQPAAQIVRLNSWLREFAARERLEFIDYYADLATPAGALDPALSIDGVHPNRDGYAAMHARAAQVR